MARDTWPTTQRSVANLHLDAKNPRLGRDITNRSPRDIIDYLFKNNKAMEVAKSIATRGYFPNEPLLAIRKDDGLVVIEGNRRLAALKALHNPDLLEGSEQRKIQGLVRQIQDISAISKVPVTVAPSRRATDSQIVGRHIGTPVIAWRSENRASFILDKLDEGYSASQLEVQLGFTQQEIQSARQVRAIVDMARSLDLPEELKGKLDSPKAKHVSTLKRVFDSTVGRKYLMVSTDSDHGFRGLTTKKEFLRGFFKLVSDVVGEEQTSRSLNDNELIRKYFEDWDPKDRPKKKQGTFVPSDIIRGRHASTASKKAKTKAATKKAKQPHKTVIPKSFKVVHDNRRLREIRDELTKLKREDFPNACAVLLRVFYELSVIDYCERTGETQKLIDALAKHGKRLKYHPTPTLKEITPVIIKIAKEKLGSREAKMVGKAVKHDPAAPFSISELHGFVHGSDLPSPRDILQFWNRTEPLFRLMLEQDA